MKAFVEQPKQLSIKDAIATTKKEHLADLEKLYTQHIDEYREETLNRYRSNDETWYDPDSLKDADVKLKVRFSNGCLTSSGLTFELLSVLRNFFTQAFPKMHPSKFDGKMITNSSNMYIISKCFP